jgi:phosphopantetheinyl transferase (holo-ACP synthase)
MKNEYVAVSKKSIDAAQKKFLALHFPMKEKILKAKLVSLHPTSAILFPGMAQINYLKDTGENEHLRNSFLCLSLRMERQLKSQKKKRKVNQERREELRG